MSIAQQINFIITKLPETEQRLILELVKRIGSSDDILTDEDITDIEEARAEYARGETINHNDIKWEQ